MSFDPATGRGFVVADTLCRVLRWDLQRLTTRVGGLRFRHVDRTVVERSAHRQPAAPGCVEEVVRTTHVLATLRFDLRRGAAAGLAGVCFEGLGSSTTIRSGGCEHDDHDAGVERWSSELQVWFESDTWTLWAPQRSSTTAR